MGDGKLAHEIQRIAKLKLANVKATVAWLNCYNSRPNKASKRRHGAFRRHFFLPGGICMHATKGARPMFNKQKG